MTVGEVMNSIISLDKCKLFKSKGHYRLSFLKFIVSVFDPEGPMYSPMANPEDPVIRSEDEDNAALESMTENSLGNQNN